MYLNQIVKQRQRRIQQEKANCSLDQIKKQARQVTREGRSLKTTLEQKGVGIIAEIKRASPSLGVICEVEKIERHVQSYEEGGACAISVLTELDYFLGQYEDLEKVRGCTDLPLLNKDFIIDEWQIYKAKCIGADIILLIVAILTEKQLQEYRQLASLLGLEVLIEVHDEKELRRALKVGPDLLGINNRNLKTFEVSLAQTLELMPHIADTTCVISESGIKTSEDIKALHAKGVKGFLIGETLMGAARPDQKIKELLGGVSDDVPN
ncbi:MAG: indole-3-glycerol phosphate synthase TrpC [Cellulosilyticaceae bacterium]